MTKRGNKISEYRTWCHLRARCKNPNDRAYARYGGRGISYCPTWESFDQFYADMGPKGDPKNSLDRIDNEKGYSKENCRWTDARTQCRNKCNTGKFTARGVTASLIEWSEILGWPRTIIRGRMVDGMSFEQAIDTPYTSAPPIRQLEAFGIIAPLKLWSEVSGIDMRTILSRVRRDGMTPEVAVTRPIRNR